MLILAIDTALDACAAAVLDTSAGGVIAQESQPMKRGHAEALMPLIARVMKASGVAFAALDRIAATTGPGSFTGLRVGLSAARGIALAAGKPVVGVTTLTAFAAPIVSDNSKPHPVLAAIDARHDHVYFQVIGGDGSSLIKPKVAPIAEALEAARPGAPYLVGNAAKILADEAELLSIAIDAIQRGRGLSRNLLLTHLGHLAGRGVCKVFLEVEENNQPARRLYEWAGFEVVGRRERYYQQPGGEQLNALLMRRDLS